MINYGDRMKQRSLGWGSELWLSDYAVDAGQEWKRGVIQGVARSPLCCLRSVSGDENVVSSWCAEGLSCGESDGLLLGTEGETRRPLLHVLILECFRLAIISMSERHILGWHVLNPFNFIAPGFVHFNYDYFLLPTDSRVLRDT